MTQKLKVKNLLGRPYQVRAAIGLVELSPGEEWEGEFEDGEATALNGNESFEVSGYTEPKGGTSSQSSGKDADVDDLRRFKSSVGPIAARLKIGDAAQFTDRVIAALDEKDERISTLEAENAAMREQIAKFDGNGDGNIGGSTSTNSQPMTLTAAVNSLDDKDDAHWTEGGKPDLKVLAGLTGGDVKRADVDAIGRQRKTS